MKLSSPFLEYIPECKRKMRRLRKKIYKYLTSRNTSKNPTKPIHKTKDLQSTLKPLQLPLVLQEMLSNKKSIDIHTVRNLNLSTKVSIEDMINLVNKQQSTVNHEYCKWQIEEQQKERNRKESLYAKQLMLKRTISSTEQSEFGLDSYPDQSSQSQNICQQYYNQMNDSSNMNGQFNPFIIQNGFLSMLSSVFSQQNLFK